MSSKQTQAISHNAQNIKPSKDKDRKKSRDNSTAKILVRRKLSKERRSPKTSNKQQKKDKKTPEKKVSKTKFCKSPAKNNKIVIIEYIDGAKKVYQTRRRSKYSAEKSKNERDSKKEKASIMQSNNSTKDSFNNSLCKNIQSENQKQKRTDEFLLQSFQQCNQNTKYQEKSCQKIFVSNLQEKQYLNEVNNHQDNKNLIGHIFTFEQFKKKKKIDSIIFQCPQQTSYADRPSELLYEGHQDFSAEQYNTLSIFSK